MIKEIPNYPNYFADTDGNIYSNKTGNLKKITPWLDGKGNYLQVGLWKNNKRYRLLVHRLVAITFMSNIKKPKNPFFNCGKSGFPAASGKIRSRQK